MSKTPELLNCANCGATNIFIVVDTYIGKATVVCECGMSAIAYSDDDPAKKVAEIWNTRVYPHEVQSAIERGTPKKPNTDILSWRCPNCADGLFSMETPAVCPSCGQRLDWSGE